MTHAEDLLVTEARRLMQAKGLPDPDVVIELSKSLRRKQKFKTARQLLERARQHSALTSERRFVQQQALCQSKDTSLPYRRHIDALELLKAEAALETTSDKETLGIAGGILKRMWARSGETRFLTQGLYYYELGLASADGQDYGYNGINAAFVNDQLAMLGDPRTALERCQRATQIRESLARLLPSLRSQEAWLAKEWWYLATVAETLLGLHQYSDASQWLREAQALNVDESERQVTATQLADLRRLQDQLRVRLPGPLVSTPSESRSEAVGAPASALDVVRSAFPGAVADEPVADLGRRMGIALSGGGFRASFYHLGVLARLADEDELRRVEVLSCVSGGSIVGAHYYLEIRNLLQRKPDGKIEQKDYVKLVRRLVKCFLAGVRRNLRTRVLASPQVSLAILRGAQTRTKYLGDLFETELYARVRDRHPRESRAVSTNCSSSRSARSLTSTPKNTTGAGRTRCRP
jgi:tetratricopeptide (TPR) repeat protein